jgi:hypothetical protein
MLNQYSNSLSQSALACRSYLAGLSPDLKEAASEVVRYVSVAVAVVRESRRCCGCFLVFGLRWLIVRADASRRRLRPRGSGSGESSRGAENGYGVCM